MFSVDKSMTRDRVTGVVGIDGWIARAIWHEKGRYDHEFACNIATESAISRRHSEDTQCIDERRKISKLMKVHRL